MAAELLPERVHVPEFPQPLTVAELSPDEKIFKAFKVKKTTKENGRVMDLSFCPAMPHRLAVCSGTKVQIWKNTLTVGEDEKALQIDATLTKFKDVTQCTAWRNDGRLLLTGEASGSCAVIEVDTKSVLRRFRGHGDAVTCAAFATADRTRAATGCRDGKLRIWDVATSELVATIEAHSDNLKCVTAGPGSADSWITASYDKKVKVWDLRAPSGQGGDGGAACIACMDHGHPVETGVAFPGASMYISAGGPAVKVWDLMSGGKLLNSVDEAHSKAVTCLSLDAKAEMLLTASFDGFAKVWHAATLSPLYSWKLPAPAICASWRPNGSAFVVGLDDGQWVMRERKTEQDIKKLEAQRNAKRFATLKTTKTKGHLRGWDAKPAEDDEVFEARDKRRKRESDVDFFMRKFEYEKAIHWLISSGDSATIGREKGLAIIDEMVVRGCLAGTLGALSADNCVKFLTVLLKYLGRDDSLATNMVFEAMHTLFDYNTHLQPPTQKNLILVIHAIDTKVAQMMKTQQHMVETSGMLRAVMQSGSG